MDLYFQVLAVLNESIKGYGNAVVPRVVYEIFKVIEEYDKP